MEKLKDRIKNVNKWIVENPNVIDPNMYEITELCIELGKEAALQKVADTDNKYPTDPDLMEAYQGMTEMIHLRKLDFLSLRDSKNELFSIDDPMIKLLNELIYKTQIGEYFSLDEMPMAKELKEKLLKKLMGVGLYIKQQERDNPNYSYDNEAEMNELEEMYQIYMTKFEKTNYLEGDQVGMPQFGYQMQPVMTGIRKKYQPITLESNEETRSRTL